MKMSDHCLAGEWSSKVTVFAVLLLLLVVVLLLLSAVVILLYDDAALPVCMLFESESTNADGEDMNLGNSGT